MQFEIARRLTDAQKDSLLDDAADQIALDSVDGKGRPDPGKAFSRIRKRVRPLLGLRTHHRSGYGVYLTSRPAKTDFFFVIRCLECRTVQVEQEADFTFCIGCDKEIIL